MKKFLALMAALLLTLPLFLPVPAAPAQAENPQYALLTLTSQPDQPSCIVEDAAFLRWLQALLTADAPCELPEIRPADRVWEIAFYGSEDMPVYTVYHDDLNNVACIIRPDGTVHSVSVNLPEMLWHALQEPLSFAIPESHRTLLQKYGWTIAFRHPHMAVQLPARLAASRTDAAALHFAWADLFLRDAGYDITPWLGKVVVPYVYTLYETVPRTALHPELYGDVRVTLRAVVLECDGQVIGAYLMAYSWDGSDLMSLKGRAAPELLGEVTLREYLLERLPLTTQETELSALTPEEVITRYGASNTPALMAIDELLRGLGTASSTLYDPLALAAAPSGDTVTVLRRLDLPDGHIYEVETAHGLRFPALVYESDSTGWKIESFYNTGF